jgi:HEAT repeat protein
MMSNQNIEVTRLLRELSSRYAIPRRKAADALAEIGTPAVVSLIHALKDNNPDVQEAAAYALERIGTRVAKAAAEGWQRRRGNFKPQSEPQIIGEDATI